MYFEGMKTIKRKIRGKSSSLKLIKDTNERKPFIYRGNRFDADGFDVDGFDIEGHNRRGFNRKFTHRNGEKYDKYGYDFYGFNSFGYDSSGFNKHGFDNKGYDRFGFDSNGKDKQGRTKGEIAQLEIEENKKHFDNSKLKKPVGMILTDGTLFFGNLEEASEIQNSINQK